MTIGTRRLTPLLGRYDGAYLRDVSIRLDAPHLPFVSSLTTRLPLSKHALTGAAPARMEKLLLDTRSTKSQWPGIVNGANDQRVLYAGDVWSAQARQQTQTQPVPVVPQKKRSPFAKGRRNHSPGN
ncbi:MAG: hypothetical protein HYU66_18825 [Armatimonadetes bacterium]|nr:hypothetical protein [Armatimonadota bacterium]